jgi:hypothetical protein
MNSPLMSGGYPFPAGSDVLGPVSGDRLFGGGLRLTMSALLRITDSRRTSRHVRKVPKPEVAASLTSGAAAYCPLGNSLSRT